MYIHLRCTYGGKREPTGAERAAGGKPPDGGKEGGQGMQKELRRTAGKRGGRKMRDEGKRKAGRDLDAEKHGVREYSETGRRLSIQPVHEDTTC